MFERLAMKVLSTTTCKQFMIICYDLKMSEILKYVRSITVQYYWVLSIFTVTTNQYIVY